MSPPGLAAFPARLIPSSNGTRLSARLSRKRVAFLSPAIPLPLKSREHLANRLMERGFSVANTKKIEDKTRTQKGEAGLPQKGCTQGQAHHPARLKQEEGQETGARPVEALNKAAGVIAEASGPYTDRWRPGVVLLLLSFLSQSISYASVPPAIPHHVNFRERLSFHSAGNIQRTPGELPCPTNCLPASPSTS